MEFLFIANAKRANEKIAVLNNIDVKLKVLKTIIRLGFDIKAMDQKNYLKLQESLQEIGKMLGGWIKSVKEKYPAG